MVAHIENLSLPPSPADFARLTVLLTDAVTHGASIGFLWPLANGEAEAYWRKVLGDLASGLRLLLVAREKCDLLPNARIRAGTGSSTPASGSPR